MTTRLRTITVLAAVAVIALVAGLIAFGILGNQTHTTTSTNTTSPSTTTSIQTTTQSTSTSSSTKVTPTTSTSQSTITSSSTQSSTSTTTSSSSSSTSIISSTSSSSNSTTTTIKTSAPVFVWLFGYVGDEFYPQMQLGLYPSSVIAIAQNLSALVGPSNLRIVAPVDQEQGHNIQAQNISMIKAQTVFNCHLWENWPNRIQHDLTSKLEHWNISLRERTRPKRSVVWPRPCGVQADLAVEFQRLYAEHNEQFSKL